MNYTITYNQRGIEECETVYASDILSAIGEFYRNFGWKVIVKIEQTN